MIISIKDRRKTVCLAASLAALVVISGCAGITPYEPRNHREEGPEKGLFSGSAGEVVIFQKGDEPVSGSEDKKSPSEAESAAKP